MLCIGDETLGSKSQISQGVNDKNCGCGEDSGTKYSPDVQITL